MKRVVALISLLSLLGCAESDTSAVLHLTTKSGGELAVRVCDAGGSLVLDRTFEVGGQTTKRILLEPRNQDPTRRFFATVELRREAEVVTRTRLIGNYVAARRERLEFELSDDCGESLCDQTYVCQGAACEVTTDSELLSAFPEACGDASPPIALAPCSELDDKDLLLCNDFSEGIGDGWETRIDPDGDLQRIGEGAAAYLEAAILDGGDGARLLLRFGDLLDGVSEFYARIVVRVSSLDYHFIKPLRFRGEDALGRYEVGAVIHGERSPPAGAGSFIFLAAEEVQGDVGPPIEPNAWTCLRLHVVLGQPGFVEVALGDKWSQRQDLSDPPDGSLDEVYVGAVFLSGGSGVFDVDDFAMALRPLGCEP